MKGVKLGAGRTIGLLSRPELGPVADRGFSLRIRGACGVVVGIMEDRRPLIAENDDMDLHGFAVVVLLRSSATPRCRQVKEGAGKIETRCTSHSGKP